MNKRSNCCAPKKCTALQVPGKKYLRFLKKLLVKIIFAEEKTQMFKSPLTEAEGRRELTQHGVLPCLAGGEVWEGAYLDCAGHTVSPAMTYCTACLT
jgi:hypothetical protein